ncbi:hypothetical protein C8J56DRAFT_960357 [Mycena floridula]|nr:hypothetical protein C8J56DRAFT_960357 [Mycena floridula]
MIDIPAELWIKIASFLPSDSLKNIYALNSLFLDLSLTERYRILDLDSTCSLGCIRHVSDPNIARRVRSISVTPHHLTFRAQNSNEILKSFLSHFRRRHTRIDILLKDMLACFSAVGPHVENLALMCERAMDDTTLSPQYLEQSWSCLKQVTLKILPQNIPSVLPALKSLPRLERLNLSLYGSLDHLTVSFLVDFLNSLSATLITLKLIAIADAFTSSLFQGLSHFPNLCSIKLTLMGHLTDTDSLFDFLERHSETIRAFYCLGNSSDKLLLLPKLKFRHLERLHIDARLLFNGNLVPVGLGKFKDLTELALISAVPGSKATSLLQSFQLDHLSWLNLQRLQLCLVEVTPGLLDLVARHLPRLRSLSLEIIWVIDEALVRIVPEVEFPYITTKSSQFAQDMRSRSQSALFQQWDLHDITITRYPEICWGLMLLLGECVPSIQNYNGYNRMELPEKGRSVLNSVQ